MARIKNVELPNNKQAYIGLTHIYGIGQATAKKICKAAKVDKSKKIGDLTNEEIAALRSEIDKHTVEGDLRREVQMNIKNKMEIKWYKVWINKKFLPVRGKRNNINDHTRKGRGKVIANKKK